LVALDGRHHLRSKPPHTHDPPNVPHRVADGTKERRTTIFHEMPTVCHLHRFWAAALTGRPVATAAIPCDDLDRRPCRQPRLNRRRLAIWQDIDDPALFEVTDDGSIAVTLPPGPVIDPDHSGCAISWQGSAAHHPEKGIAAHRENKARSSALPRSATEGKTDVVDNTFETLCPSPKALCDCRVKLLGKDLHRAANRLASEPPCSKLQAYR
jgi:hypothetical protein